MDQIFDWCVQLLIDWAKFFHTTYKAINVWIFVIIEPIIFVVMLWLLMKQYKQIRRLKKQLNNR
jgi:hypothetical protein